MKCLENFQKKNLSPKICVEIENTIGYMHEMWGFRKFSEKIHKKSVEIFLKISKYTKVCCFYFLKDSA